MCSYTFAYRTQLDRHMTSHKSGKDQVYYEQFAFSLPQLIHSLSSAFTIWQVHTVWTLYWTLCAGWAWLSPSALQTLNGAAVGVLDHWSFQIPPHCGYAVDHHSSENF